MSKKTFMEQAERWFGDTSAENSAQVMATLAIAEAINAQTQAQTEQLKRIADALTTPGNMTIADLLEAANDRAGNPYR